MHIGGILSIKPEEKDGQIHVKRGGGAGVHPAGGSCGGRTCAGNREPGSGVCNTVGQTLARPAGHLASPSPFLWSTVNLYTGGERFNKHTKASWEKMSQDKVTLVTL